MIDLAEVHTRLAPLVSGRMGVGLAEPALERVGARTTTTDSSTRFIAGAPVGSVVTGECSAFHRGRSTMVWQTLVRLDSVKLCAVVTQTQLVMVDR